MTANSPRPKIGLLALTLELYEQLAPGLREGREKWVRTAVLPALAELAEVTFRRAVFRREDIEAEVAALQAGGADALLVILLTYSPSQLALPALKRAGLPICIWNTQELYAVDEGFDGPAMVDNHGVHGTQDLANVLLRAGVRFRYATSHVRDSEATAELGDFFAAAMTAGRLRQARLGLLGYPFPGMGDFALDTTQMVSTLGCQWQVLGVEEYVRRAAAAPAEQAAALAAEYRRVYDVAADISPADLEATARVELALRGMVADRKLDALTYQFMAFGDDERTPTVPFVAASRLMADGVGFGGEGDLIAAAGTALLNWLSGPASFTEVFTIDFAGNAVLLSHMGEANVAMARPGRKVPLAARPTPITRTRGRQLALVTSFQPGLATLCALTLGPGGRWRLIAGRGRIGDFGPLPAMQVPHSKFIPDRDVRDYLTAYALAGGPHHAAVCFGDALRRLRMLADLIDADFFEV